MTHSDTRSVRPNSLRPHSEGSTAESNTVAIVLPDLRIGGAERVALNLARFLLDQGHAVTLVLGEKAGDYLEQLDARARVVDLSARRMRNAVKPLVEYFRREKPVATLAFMWPLTVIAVVARAMARSKTRLVVTEHTTWSRSELVQNFPSRLIARTTMNVAFRGADAIVCVSEGAANDLAAFANIRRSSVHAIYNPIVRDPLPPIENVSVHEPLSWWTGPHKRILAVGALIPLKGFGTLLRSLAEVRKTLDAKLLILGEGPARRELEREVRRLQLEDNVFLLGAVRDPTPYYTHAELSVMSSEVEGFGNVLVEALACGTPVVSTDCPSGPREILDHGAFGRLVPVGDLHALAEAIVLTLRTPPSAEYLRARARVFSIAAAGKLYQSLLFPQTRNSTLDTPEEKAQT